MIFTRADALIRVQVKHHESIWEDAEDIDWEAFRRKETEVQVARAAKPPRLRRLPSSGSEAAT